MIKALPGCTLYLGLECHSLNLTGALLVETGLPRVLSISDPKGMPANVRDW